MSANNSIRVQFRISDEMADIVNEHATRKGLSVNEATKDLLIEKCLHNDDLTLLTLKSSIRQLTLLQRLIAQQVGSNANELLDSAYHDEMEILRNMGIDND